MRHLILSIISSLFISNSVAQIDISGTITDSKKEPAIGGIVQEKNTNNRTMTDFDGHYKLTVADTNAVIEVQYMGFETKLVKVGSQTTINLTLKELDKFLETIITGKPVIYLYPEEETDISVQFSYNGKVSITYPEYNNGWYVHALPNGTLYNKADNKEYSYLFWDGEKKYKPEETIYSSGFIVSKDSTISFLQEILPKTGLKPSEYNEFIVYWTPYLKANEWNFIYFRTAEEYNVISKNSVKPQPDTEIRVFMEFKKIEKPFVIEPQVFKLPTRKGFTLVEWGGSMLKDSISVKDRNGNYIKK